MRVKKRVKRLALKVDILSDDINGIGVDITELKEIVKSITENHIFHLQKRIDKLYLLILGGFMTSLGVLVTILLTIGLKVN